jgi:hypothetical protein
MSWLRRSTRRCGRDHEVVSISHAADPGAPIGMRFSALIHVRGDTGPLRPPVKENVGG